jgi:hypothetical protein
MIIPGIIIVLNPGQSSTEEWRPILSARTRQITLVGAITLPCLTATCKFSSFHADEEQPTPL